MVASGTILFSAFSTQLNTKCVQSLIRYLFNTSSWCIMVMFFLLLLQLFASSLAFQLALQLSVHADGKGHVRLVFFMKRQSWQSDAQRLCFVFSATNRHSLTIRSIIKRNTVKDIQCHHCIAFAIQKGCTLRARTDTVFAV